MSNKVLIVVDMQNDFIYGALGSEEARKIAPNVVKKAEEAVKSGRTVIFTRDTHSESYLDTQEGRNLPVPHCIEGTEGWKIIPELKKYTDCSWMVNKSSFGCDYWEEILPIRVDGIELVGVCTDICVISNALILKPFTRDTFGVAIKATYCEINDVPVMIFKNPKESGFKKSQKGCCLVYEGMDGEFRCADGLTWCDAVHADIQEMNCVFRNGEMVREQTLAGIRELLHGGKF